MAKNGTTLFDLYKVDPRRELAAPVASGLAIPIESVLFVLDSILNAAHFRHAAVDLSADVLQRRIEAKDICRSVSGYAAGWYGVNANTRLAELGIKRSEDVGAIVFELCQSGLLIAEPTDLREDFEDAWDFTKPFKTSIRFRPSGGVLRKRLMETMPPGWLVAVPFVVFAGVLGYIGGTIYSDASNQQVEIAATLGAAGSLLLAFGVWGFVRRRRRRRLQSTNYLLCTKCMYPLVGLASESECPECGAKYIHGDIQREWLAKYPLRQLATSQHAQNH